MSGVRADGYGATPGVDLDAVTAWLVDHVDGLCPPLRATLIAGGRSNLTYLLEDAMGGRWVLRRPPLGHVLPTAHDMAREHRILAALRGSPVPVPSVVGLCEDLRVTGATFYVMEHVDGHVLRGRADAERVLASATERHAAAEALVRGLAELHAVNPAAVGLGDLGRPTGYLERQLRRWHAQLATVTAGGAPDLKPLLRVHELLAAALPPDPGTVITHGDYRLDNALVGRGGDVRAVLDWELCTLGDPLADLGTLLVYWAEPGDVLVPLVDAPTLATGFPGRAALAGMYAEATGRRLDQLPFYVAFGAWKLACILVGVQLRFAAGVQGGGAGTQDFTRTIAALAEAAERTLDGDLAGAFA